MNQPNDQLRHRLDSGQALLSLVVAAAMVIGVYFEDQTPSNKRSFRTLTI
jgi:hypothetical protein